MNDKATNMEKINSKGRTFVNGCALSQDLRKLIVDEIVRNGGDINSGYFPGKFSDVANALKVSRTTVKNIWQRLHMELTNEPRQHGGGKNSNLTQGDLQLIETVKGERPTLSLREIYDGLTEFGDIPKGTSRSTISRAFNNNMLSGLKYSWKKISTVAVERFSAENMAYTQMFIYYFYAKDPTSYINT